MYLTQSYNKVFGCSTKIFHTLAVRFENGKTHVNHEEMVNFHDTPMLNITQNVQQCMWKLARSSDIPYDNCCLVFWLIEYFNSHLRLLKTCSSVASEYTYIEKVVLQVWVATVTPSMLNINNTAVYYRFRKRFPKDQPTVWNRGKIRVWNWTQRSICWQVW